MSRRAICGVLSLVVFLALSLPHPTLALKQRVSRSATIRTLKPATVRYSSVKLERPNLIISFYNLDKVTQIDYILSYTANGLEQGAGGTVRYTGSTTDSRTLYFGTCSRGICVPHTNIKDAVLLVTTKLKDGTTHTKRYIIKY